MTVPAPTLDLVAPGYEPVADAFAKAFEEFPQMGGALSVLVDGTPVVEGWGGLADTRDGSPWRQDTATVVFSCTKGIMSILVAKLVEDGCLRYDAPVATYWPEFAAEGKEAITVREILSHRSGLSAPRRPFTTAQMLAWDPIVEGLAAQEPLWEPDSAYAYHAITHGWLIGEVMRRVTGKMPGELLRETIAEPLAADLWLGLDPALEPRVAHLTVGSTLADLVAVQDAEAAAAGGIDWPGQAMTLGGALPRALVTPDGGFNAPAAHEAQIPGAGGIATARGLATAWSATVTTTAGVRLVGDGVLDEAAAVQTEGAPFYPAPAPWPRWGMGFQLDSQARHYLGVGSIGHDGAGGQVAFGDREHGVGFAFVTNQMEAIDHRATRIVDALGAVLRG